MDGCLYVCEGSGEVCLCVCHMKLCVTLDFEYVNVERERERERERVCVECVNYSRVKILINQVVSKTTQAPLSEKPRLRTISIFKFSRQNEDHSSR